MRKLTLWRCFCSSLTLSVVCSIVMNSVHYTSITQTMSCSFWSALGLWYCGFLFMPIVLRHSSASLRAVLYTVKNIPWAHYFVLVWFWISFEMAWNKKKRLKLNFEIHSFWKKKKKQTTILHKYVWYTANKQFHFNYSKVNAALLYNRWVINVVLNSVLQDNC